MTKRRIMESVLFAVLAIGVDQISKRFASDIALNTGISFGLLSGTALSLGLILVLVALAGKFGRLFLATSTIGTGLFFGGSLSNILDRLLYGGVRDFLPIPVFEIKNNLADWMIILALCWLFFRLQSGKTEEKV